MAGIRLSSVAIDWDNDGSFATSGDEIVNYVKAINAVQGIQAPLQRVADIGTLSITLDNQDRRFSPAYTSGALYGKLLPNRPVRVQVTDGSTTWTVFRGVTRSIKPMAGQYGMREAIIECVDLLGVLQDFNISIPLQTDQNPAYLLKMVTSTAFRSAKASGYFQFSANPANNDTVTVNGVTYTFKTSSVSSANQVLIGTTVEDTIDNLVNAINGGPGAGTTYGTNTTRPTGCAASARMTYYREVQKSRPVRYYRLGESAGTNADDVGENGRDGTYVNTPTLGVAGALSGDSDTAVTFDPTATEYVDIPVFSITNTSFTFECWVNASASSPPASQVPISFAGAETTRFIVYSNGDLLFAVKNLESVDAVGVFTFGAWHHMVVTYNAASDTSYIYLDGEEVGSGSAGPVTETKTTAYIGTEFPGFTHWKGEIDEVAMYRRALSPTEVAAHYAARSITRGVNIYANARGAWGNAITLAESSSVITVSGAVLSGGVDGPASLYSYETGNRTIDIAGNTWSSDSTNALTAVTQIVESEYGLFWAARDGTLTFKNSDYEFNRAAATAALTLSSEHSALDTAVTAEMVYNRIVVSSVPTSTLSSGVIARARDVIAVPGKWGIDRANPADDVEAGLVVVKLPYVDPGTGQFSGAQSLTLPLVANTDFTVNEQSDGSGVDYTTNANIVINAAINGSNVEVSFRNTALGTLYVRDLQVRGVGIVTYDQAQYTLDDADSQDAYGRQTLSVELPLPVTSGQSFAAALAEYLLGKYKTPVSHITSIDFAGQTVVGAVNLFSLNIGDVLTITDYQTGITSAKYMITGLSYSVSAGDPAETSLMMSVRAISDVTYWILGDSTYGVLGSTTRLGL